MKLIISPAKKMKEELDFLEPDTMPVFLEEAEKLTNEIKKLSYQQFKVLLCCGDSLAKLNFERYQTMNLHKNLTPAIFAFDGIQYQYMAPQIFSDSAFSYIRRHLRILSGLYGILRPFDGVAPYRLEMQAKPTFCKNLYKYWGKRIYQELTREDDVIVNLASNEYANVIEPYKHSNIKYITCIFGELVQGKIRQKGVHVKMARGQMVRYLAEEGIQDIQGICSFDALGYRYCESVSTSEKLVFLKEK